MIGYASSAFPPVFPPLKLTHDEYPVEDVDFVTLTDGGVYDNLGVNPLVRERNDLDYLIVSDAGKPFAIDESPTERGTIVLKRSIDILMEQVRGLQFSKLEKLANKKIAWFSIDSYPKEKDIDLFESIKMDALFASQIGTNLKKLSQHELDVLVRHGERLSSYRMDQYMGEL